MKDDILKSMLAEYREETLKGIEQYIPDKEPKKYLYDLIADYPNRGGKGFRPGLCISVCKIYGGELKHVINTAIALELFHNAFLVHDDIEDNSSFRRDKPTMHESNNIAIAINVGDAMNVLSIAPLIKNKEILGAKLSWEIFEEIHQMVTETVEGQAIELGWRKDNECNLTESDYFRMVLKKTCWYTCIHPMKLGAIIGSRGKAKTDEFQRFGYFMGAAFQIQDDILNLVAEREKYGKEIGGDIVEGKRTLMLIHLLNNCNKDEHHKIKNFLGGKPNPNIKDIEAWILEKMHFYGSIDHARKIAKNLAGAALKEFYSIFSSFPDSKDKAFLKKIIIYMINREY